MNHQNICRPGGYVLPGMGGMSDPNALAANPLLANSIATSLANGTLDGMALSAGLAAMPPGGLAGLSLNPQMGSQGANGMPGPGANYPGEMGNGMGNGGGGGVNRGQADALAVQNLSKLSAAGRAGGGNGTVGAGGGGFSPTGARLWGQKIGSNDKFNEWKLFIGQVPLEVRKPGSEIDSATSIAC